MKNQDDAQRHPDSRRQFAVCSLSTQCLLYADILERSTLTELAQLGDLDEREARVVEQLRAHVPTCPDCRATLAEVQRQRKEIGNTLRLAERDMPSTTPRIIAVIRQEALSTPQPHQTPIRNQRYQDEFPLHLPVVETPVPKRRHGNWMEVLSIAVAAVLVLSTLGVLGRLVLFHSVVGSANSSTTTSTHSPVLAPLASWSSVVVTYALDNKTVIANYNPLNGQNVSLASFAHVQVAVDGVAHSGYKVLYHVYDGTQTRYYLYPQTQQPVFTTTGMGGPAFWSSADNDRYLFINTHQGIAQVDMVAHASHVLSLAAVSPLAVFYRDGYLYYVSSTSKTPYMSSGQLYRLDITNSTARPTLVTPCTQATDFLLSPFGSTIYYHCPAQDQRSLYTVTGDGTDAHLLRSDAGQIVGYTADNSLIVLQRNNGHYQVVQLGATTQQDKVLLSDVAPGANSISQSDVAVAPYGYVLVAKATYANTVEKLWYGDLMTQATQLVSLPVGVHNVNAIGWDRLTPTPQGG